MDRRLIRAGLVAVAGAGLWLAASAVLSSERPAATGLRFEVTVAPGLLPKPTDGRLLVVLGRGGFREPRSSIGATGLDAAPLLGADVRAFGPGVVGVADGSSAIFPIDSLAKLPAGDYTVQAV